MNQTQSDQTKPTASEVAGKELPEQVEAKEANLA